jgi:glycosyltransferase involved in cell wall biosynthesis
MKVAIVNLTGGGLSNGYINYLSEIVPRMLRHPQLSQIYVYVPTRYLALFSGLMPPENLQPCDDSRTGSRRLRQSISEIAPDVVFFPCNRWINLGRIPSVAMIRNMLPLVMPFGGNGWMDVVKNLGRARLSRIACNRADRVIAVSEYVQQFLVDAWHIPPTRIGTVYHGVTPPSSLEAMSMPASVPPEWRGEFLFTAGSLHPYRGLDDVLNALAVLVSQGGRPSLVIAGGADRTQLAYLKRMQNLAQKLGIQSQIAWAGHLNAEQMSWCYSHCRLFLMTSRVEACPNIALEAMSHGAFCLAANNPPLPEFFGKAAIYYRPKCGEALAQAISSALAYSPEASARLRRQAEERAADFTWEDTTERLIHELELATKMLYS